MRLVNWLAALKGLVSSTRTSRPTAWRRGRRTRRSSPAAVVQSLESRAMLSATYSIALSSPSTAIEPYDMNSAQPVEFIITRDDTSNMEVISYNLEGSASLSDYEVGLDGMANSSSGSIMFMNGDYEKRIRITPWADYTAEGPETVTLRLTP